MKRLLATLFFTLLFFPAGTWAEGETPREVAVQNAPVCETNTRRADAYEIGAGIQSLYPNGLPDFVDSLPLYSASVGLPIFDQTLLFQGSYGGSGDLTASIFEAGYRLNGRLPFINCYFLVGGHLLSYSAPGRSKKYWGANVGFGVEADLANWFGIVLGTKFYIQDRSLFAVGGGFSLYF